jgi:hypothetical protein
MSIILPSVFTVKKLAEIQRVNEAVSHLTELLSIVKKQRHLLEGLVGKIESDSNYRRFQNQLDSLLLEERSINKDINLQQLKVLIDMGVEEKGCFLGYSVVD